jgi:HAD superfamily hydrolase (TIGR01509 family)
MDGTLLDTESIYFASYKAAVEALAGAEAGRSSQLLYTEAFHVEHLLGRPEGAGAAAIQAQLGLRCSSAELLAARDALLLPAFERVAALPGAHGAMAALKAALPPGRLAIATSSKERLLQVKSKGPEAASLLALFDAVICSDSAAMAGQPGKPHPAIFQAAAAALGLQPQQCVAFEDSLTGIASAAAAGCFVVAVPDARLPQGSAAAAGAHVVLQSLEQFELSLVGLAPAPAASPAASPA